MESLEIKGKTVEEAIQNALDQLGVGREEVEVTVVKEGKSGILGLGSDEAVVMVTPFVPLPQAEVAEIAEGVLDRLISLMGLIGSVTPQDKPFFDEGEAARPSVSFDIRGDDLGILIGRRGQTLACLQYLVRLIVGNQTKNRIPIVVDVEGYKQRRYQTLQSLAHQMAEQVKVRETSVTLEPMPAYERRIVHLTLADDPDVSTESIGQGEARRVVIAPKEQ